MYHEAFVIWDHTWSVLLFIALVLQYMIIVIAFLVDMSFSYSPKARLFKDKRMLFFWSIPWIWVFTVFRAIGKYFISLPWKAQAKRR